MKMAHGLIQKKSLMRLKASGIGEKKLSDPNDTYYGKPEKYSMSIFTFSQCFKCKNPYFGGIIDESFP